MLRERLSAGRLARVHRGEYVQRLPTGLVRLADGRVEKDPDAQLRQAIDLVFTKFAERGHCQRVLRYFKRAMSSCCRGAKLVVCCAASCSGASRPRRRFIASSRTRTSAGAFVYGRRPTDPTRQRPGRRATGGVRKPLAEWSCILHNRYPAYLSWEQYLANHARLADNAQRYAERCARGVPRQGAALLQGLARLAGTAGG
jgi:hypothetical protein